MRTLFYTIEIKKHIAVLSTSGTWRKEVNLVSWYGKEAKYDIRDWSKDYSSCGKGITLTEEEYEVLINLGCSKKSNSVDESKKIEALEAIRRLAETINEKIEEDSEDELITEEEECTETEEAIETKKTEDINQAVETEDPNSSISKDELDYETNLSFTQLNKYLQKKYGRNFTELWQKEEKELYNLKDPLSDYSETGETDYFSGNEDSSDPFIWEKAGKTAPQVPQAGSGAYIPRKKR